MGRDRRVEAQEFLEERKKEEEEKGEVTEIENYNESEGV